MLPLQELIPVPVDDVPGSAPMESDETEVVAVPQEGISEMLQALAELEDEL